MKNKKVITLQDLENKILSASKDAAEGEVDAIIAKILRDEGIAGMRQRSEILTSYLLTKAKGRIVLERSKAVAKVEKEQRLQEWFNNPHVDLDSGVGYPLGSRKNFKELISRFGEKTVRNDWVPRARELSIDKDGFDRMVHPLGTTAWDRQNTFRKVNDQLEAPGWDPSILNGEFLVGNKKIVFKYATVEQHGLYAKHVRMEAGLLNSEAALSERAITEITVAAATCLADIYPEA